jgi:hypothetical protein
MFFQLKCESNWKPTWVSIDRSVDVFGFCPVDFSQITIHHYLDALDGKNARFDKSLFCVFHQSKIAKMFKIKPLLQFL